MDENQAKLEAADSLHTALIQQEKNLEPLIRMSVRKTFRTYFDANKEIITIEKEMDKAKNNIKNLTPKANSRGIAVLVIAALLLIESIFDFLQPLNQWGLVFIFLLLYVADEIRRELKILWNMQKLDSLNLALRQVAAQERGLHLSDYGISGAGGYNLGSTANIYWDRKKRENKDYWDPEYYNDCTIEDQINDLNFENELRSSIFLMHGVRPATIFNGSIYEGN
jgi:hypothetical protein